MSITTCFGYRTCGSFLGLSVKHNSVSRTDNFVNVFNSVTSPPVLSYHCVLNYFLTMSVGFHFKLTFGLKPGWSRWQQNCKSCDCLQTIHFPSWVAHSRFVIQRCPTHNNLHLIMVTCRRRNVTFLSCYSIPKCFQNVLLLLFACLFVHFFVLFLSIDVIV